MARRKIDLSLSRETPAVSASAGKGAEKTALPVICERIRFYREKSGMGQKALAGLLGITANAVSNWEQGRSRPDVNLLPAVCRALNITLYDLYGEKMPDELLSAREKRLIEGYRALNPANRYVVDKSVETLGFVQRIGNGPEIRELLYFERSLAAGTGDPTEFEQEAEPIYLYASREVRRADYVFRVNGDSMEPAYCSGDLVLVQKLAGGASLSYGEIGAFIVGNETYIKAYQPDGLHSLNRKYGVLRFDEEQSVYLIGRVIGVAAAEDIAQEDAVRAYLAVQGAAMAR